MGLAGQMRHVLLPCTEQVCSVAAQLIFILSAFLAAVL